MDEATQISERQRRLKETFLYHNPNPTPRTWPPVWDGLLRLDPDFFEACYELIDGHWARGSLEPKVKELVYVALSSHLSLREGKGVLNHTKKALEQGASPEEVLAVIEIVTRTSARSAKAAVPILVEEMLAAGRPIATAETSEADRLRAKGLSELLGEDLETSTQTWESLLKLHPDFFETLKAFLSTGLSLVLPVKTRELVSIAVDSLATYPDVDGLRTHIRVALREGATEYEILEVIELAVGYGFLSCMVGVPSLLETVELESS